MCDDDLFVYWCIGGGSAPPTGCTSVLPSDPIRVREHTRHLRRYDNQRKGARLKKYTQTGLGLAVSCRSGKPDDERRSVPLLKGAKLSMYIIVNHVLMPELATHLERMLSGTSRAYSTLVKSQTRSAPLALYGFAERAGIAFHAASIDAVLKYNPMNPYGTVHVRAVFNLGFAKMEHGSLWKDRPVSPAPSYPAIGPVALR
jgi:hypothetical protein